MRNKQLATLSYLILAALMVLTGCKSVTPTIQRIDTILSTTLTSTPAPTHSLTATFMLPPATPVPSYPLLPDEVIRMTRLLQSEGCKLPCYLGITPGKTKLTEAKAILEGLGATHHGYYIRNTDGATGYTYELNIGEMPGTNGTPVPDRNAILIYHSVSLITNDNDTVQMIEVDVGTTGATKLEERAITTFREIWSRYSTRSIFLQLGLPDKLYIGFLNPSNMIYNPDLLILYQRIGTVIDYYGTERENNICVEDKALYVLMQLSLVNLDSGLNIYSNGRVPPTDRSDSCFSPNIKDESAG